MLAAQDLKIDLESETLLLLRHMVLSHHGRYEYGSPKLPALLEAEILHRIDDMDAMVYAVTNALQHTGRGTFTEPLLSQDGKRYYRPKHDQALIMLSIWNKSARKEVNFKKVNLFFADLLTKYLLLSSASSWNVWCYVLQVVILDWNISTFQNSWDNVLHNCLVLSHWCVNFVIDSLLVISKLTLSLWLIILITW